MLTQVAANQSATSVSQLTELLDASAKPAIKAASDVKIMVQLATLPSVQLVQAISHSGSKVPKIVLVHAVLDFTRAQKVIVALATRPVSVAVVQPTPVPVVIRLAQRLTFTKISAFRVAQQDSLQLEVYAQLVNLPARHATALPQFVLHATGSKAGASF